MGLVFSAFVPHPPVLVPEIGQGQENVCAVTLEAYRLIANRLAIARPATVVVVSPHAQLMEEGVTMLAEETLTGSFAQFGAPHLTFSIPNDLTIVKGLQERLPRVLMRRGQLDHGTMVPLYFLQRAGWQGKLVVMSMPLADPEHYGVLIGEALRNAGEPVALVASGDLSHRLRKDGPYGLHPAGPKFDDAVVKALKADVRGLQAIPPSIAEAAGECGFRSLRLALAAQEGAVEVLSYEGHFGVGYLVAELYCASQIAHWARRCLSEYLNGGNPDNLPLPAGAEFQVRRGCFVTLKKQGELRGCIGTTQGFQPNLALEIRHNALAAGTEDPRFWPVTKEELADIRISVDVLGDLEKIGSTAELDPWRYGVVVRGRGRSGLLLPHLEGVETVDRQVGIAKQKAGLREDEPVEMWRFEVVRHYE